MSVRSKALRPHGGYRRLRSFQVAEIICDGTVSFCDRFINKRSRTHDQMVQAARSGRQNIAEGSRVSATSSQTELRLVNVARPVWMSYCWTMKASFASVVWLCGTRRNPGLGRCGPLGGKSGRIGPKKCFVLTAESPLFCAPHSRGALPARCSLVARDIPPAERLCPLKSDHD
jgi:hypothetical protein